MSNFMAISQWTCECGHVNALSAACCSGCGEKIPASITDGIWEEEYTFADKVMRNEKEMRTSLRILKKGVLLNRISSPLIFLAIVLFISALFLLFHYGMLNDGSIMRGMSIITDNIKGGIKEGVGQIGDYKKDGFVNAIKTIWHGLGNKAIRGKDHILLQGRDRVDDISRGLDMMSASYEAKGEILTLNLDSALTNFRDKLDTISQRFDQVFSSVKSKLGQVYETVKK